MPDVYYFKPLRDAVGPCFPMNLKYLVSGCLGWPEHSIEKVEMTGEIIPTHDHNIVTYSKEKINKGVFVVFKLVVNDNELTISSKESDTLLRMLNRMDRLNFYSVKELEVQPKRFDSIFQPVKLQLEDILFLEGHILNTPARTVSAKSIKNALKQKIVDLVVEAKLKFLNQYQTSKFREDVAPEGLVLYAIDHNIPVKLIDKSKFTAIKEQNWFYIDIMKGFSATLRLRVKEDPANLLKYLDEYRRSLISLKINK